jgi:hypothetical protein
MGILKKVVEKSGEVAHNYILSYTGGRHQNCSSRLAYNKKLWRLHVDQ